MLCYDDYFRQRAPYHCPYGQVGSRLWVQATWHQDTGLSSDKTIHYKADNFSDSYSWKPSIFMPRWASRITLEITGVRVERVQEIITKEAIAEGFVAGLRESETDAFHNFWDSLNAKRGNGWEANPWVWAIEFVKEGSQ